MANIQEKLNNIKNALFGKDVRDSIHDGIKAMNDEVESTTARQQDLESTFDELIINAGNSNAEIVDARVGANGTSYAKLGDRLNEVDSQIKDNTNEIEYIKNKFVDVTVEEFGAKGNANYFDFVTKKWYKDSEFSELADDDSVYFKKAIDYVIANGGGTINFKSKNYFIKNRCYINPSKSIPVLLKGIKCQSANTDVYYSNSFKGGTNIIVDTDIAFPINMKEDGNQNLGVESAEFDCFYAEGIRFIGMYEGEKNVNGHTIPVFNYPIGFKIVGTRYTITDCAGYGTNSIIHQDLILPNGKFNYSDFVTVKRISSRWCNDVVVRATRCDVSIFEKIHNELATENMHSVLNVVGGINVNIRCISSSMNSNYNITPIGESGVVRINKCDCVNLENIYCERNTNWQGVISAIDSTNVKIKNVAEHSFDNTNKTNTVVNIVGSSVDINGIHSRGYRKDSEPDIKCSKGENEKMCRVVVDGVDIKEGTYSDGFIIRNERISDYRAIEGIRNRGFNFIDIKYEDSKWNVYRDGKITNEFGSPSFENGVLTFKMVAGVDLPKLLRMRKIVIPTINKINECGFTPIVLNDGMTVFQIVWYDGTVKQDNESIKHCCRIQFI